MGAEETLSGHRHMEYNIVANREQASPRMIYEFQSTNWEVFKGVLKRECERRLLHQLTVDERAEELQKIFRKACEKHIARRKILQNRHNDWWNEDCTRSKHAVQVARRRWQASRNEDDKNALVTSWSETYF